MEVINIADLALFLENALEKDRFGLFAILAQYVLFETNSSRGLLNLGDLVIEESLFYG